MEDVNQFCWPLLNRGDALQRVLVVLIAYYFFSIEHPCMVEADPARNVAITYVPTILDGDRMRVTSGSQVSVRHWRLRRVGAVDLPVGFSRTQIMFKFA